MNFKVNESEQKLRGGYYTPLPIARFLVDWAFSPGAKRVLEPSCGDGIFLTAIMDNIRDNGIRTDFQVDAAELVTEELEKANDKIQLLNKVGVSVNGHNVDFLDWIVKNRGLYWDAIVGNPPYIRYQYFDKIQKERAKFIFGQANIEFTERTNAWVPFVIASIIRLEPGGRLAMVIPAEILYVLHSDGVRRLLEQEMEEIFIIHLKEMVFKDVLQGIVLLLAVKRRDRKFMPFYHLNGNNQSLKFKIIEVNGVDELSDLDLESQIQNVIKTDFEGKWMKGLLSETELDVCNKVENNSSVLRFKEIADVNIGIVTGANYFFVVDDKTLNQYRLQCLASPMLAKSNLIKGIVYTEKDHVENVTNGKPVFFLDFNKFEIGKNPKEINDYLMIGEQEGLPARYKCRIRNPWYKVPYVWRSEIAMLKRCHAFPRLVLNKLGALSTDTAYRIRLRSRYNNRERDLVFSFINSLTFLYAELEGRHYGGGVLELVPSEIEKLHIPLCKCTQEQFDRVDKMIREKADIDQLLDYTDYKILPKLDFSEKEIKIIRNAWHRLRERRHRI
jgi:adenine-specific DNA methylase